MDDRVLKHVKTHCEKFRYELSHEQLDELVELYKMNNDAFDEVGLTLYIEKYMQRNGIETDPERSNWASARRRSVYAKPVSITNLEIPMYVKTKEEFEFLHGMLGSEIPFSFLTVDQKNRLVSSMYPLIVRPGTVLIYQGDLGSEMYIVEYGEFDIIINGQFVNKMYAGSKFGELALLHEIPRTATVVTAQQSKVWAAEQTSFTCIRISDNIYKKGLIREALETDDSTQAFRDDPSLVQEAVANANIRIVFAHSRVPLGNGEILVVFKDGRILADDGRERSIATKEILRESFTAMTDIECCIIAQRGAHR